MSYPARCHAWQNRRRPEITARDGFSLPETLVGAAVTIVVLGAILPVLWIAAGQLGGQSDRVTSLDQDRVAFDDLTRLIREAKAVEALEPTSVDGGGRFQAASLSVTTGDPARDPVVLDCGQPGSSPERFMCVRTEADGSAKQLIDGITEPAAFTLDTDRDFIGVALQLSPAGSNRPVSLEGGVSLRVAGRTG